MQSLAAQERAQLLFGHRRRLDQRLQFFFRGPILGSFAGHRSPGGLHGEGCGVFRKPTRSAQPPRQGALRDADLLSQQALTPDADEAALRVQALTAQNRAATARSTDPGMTSYQLVRSCQTSTLFSPLQSVQHHVCQSVGEIWDTAITDLKTVSCVSVTVGVSLQNTILWSHYMSRIPDISRTGGSDRPSAIASS